MNALVNRSIGWILMFIVLISLVPGCKKSDPVLASDLATKVIGDYKMSVISTVGGGTQPVSQQGTVEVTRDGTTRDQVNFEVSLSQTSTGSGKLTTENKLITLKEQGNSVDLYSSSTKVGMWTNNEMVIGGYPFNNTTISFTASK